MKSRRASSVSRFFRRNGASEKADVPAPPMRAPRATTRVLECQPDERELLRTSIIPTIVQYLGKNGLHLDDLFLKDPSASTQDAMMGLTAANQREPVRALRELLDARYSGDEASVLSAHHPYVWAISIKVALKELSKPLVPSNVSISLIDAETHDSASGKADYLKRSFVPGCPDVVQDLLHLLYACRSPKDKLGYMMAALLFLSVQSGQDEADFARLSANVESLSKATQFLVSNAEMVFGPSPFEVQAAPQVSKAAPPPPPPPGRPQFAAATSTFDDGYDEGDSGLPPTPSFPSAGASSGESDEKALFRAICIYDFDPESPDELELRVGDVITVLEIAEDDWYRGRLVLQDGVVEEGLFPANYVRKDETEKPPAPSPPKPPAPLPSSGGKVQAPPPPPPPAPAIPVFKPEFEEDEEDDNAGQMRAQMEAASLSAFSTSLAVPPPAPPPKQDASNAAASQPLKTPQGIPAVAIFDFEPEEPGELELQKGEELLVLDRTDPEWWLARRVRDGEQGLFPYNYAKLVDGPRPTQQPPPPPVPAVAQKAPPPPPPQAQEQQPKPIAPLPPAPAPQLAAPSSGNGVSASNGPGTATKGPLQRASSSRGGSRPPPPPPPSNVSLPVAGAAGAAVARQPAPLPPSATTAAKATTPSPARQPAPLPSVSTTSSINAGPSSLMPASASAMGTGAISAPLVPMASQMNMPGVPPLASTMQRPTMGMPPITSPAPQPNSMGMAPRPMMNMPPITSPAPNPVAMGWVVTPDLLDKYNRYFADRPKDMMGRVPGKDCALFLEASGLDRPTIARVLELSDIDHDNSFDQEEFALAMHLALCISRRKMPVPSKLDDYLIPPTKRALLGMRPSM